MTHREQEIADIRTALFEVAGVWITQDVMRRTFERRDEIAKQRRFEALTAPNE